jgi:photosystem II stability/assembly factor-like uncharacterized protein
MVSIFLKRAAFLLAALLTAVRLDAQTPTWKPLGPFGGSVQTLAVDPSDAGVLYVTLGQQGVFRSRDGGRSWTAVHDGVTRGNVAVDPSRPGTLYLAENGVQKSTDGGDHWSDLGLRADVLAIAVDPARPSRLYAAGDGVLRSTDGGASWHPAREPLPDGAASAVTALAVPRTGGIVYAVTGAGIYKSVDGALSWRPANQGLPAAAVLALAVAPTDPRTLYASVLVRSGRMVYRSTDGGASWRVTAALPLPGPAPYKGLVRTLAVSPASPRRAWAGTDTGDLFLTTDGGAHWAVTGPRPARPVLAIAPAPSAPTIVYLGVEAQGFDLGGVFASADGGATWMRRNQGLAGLDAEALALPPGRLWAGLESQGLFRSANGGRSWARAPLPDSPPAGGVPLANGIPLVDLERAPSDPATLYALALSWLWRTTDDGASWTEAYAPPDGPFLKFLRVDPADPFRLWGSPGAGPFGGPVAPLLRSTDGGETWSPPGLPGSSTTPDVRCGILDLQFAPSAPRTLYAAGAQGDPSTCTDTLSALARSTDDGTTWEPAGAGLGGFSTTVLAVDPVDPRLLYAGTGGDAHHLHGDGPFKSADGGTTWSRAGSELAGTTITALAVSPLAGVVWAAVDEGGGGVFRSTDGGATWQQRSAGLQAFQVHRLMIDPGDPNHLYAVTTGGIWEIEDDH